MRDFVLSFDVARGLSRIARAAIIAVEVCEDEDVVVIMAMVVE